MAEPLHVVRLDASLPRRVSDELWFTAAGRRVSLPEAVRQAIALWHQVCEETTAGRRLVIAPGSGLTPIMEVVQATHLPSDPGDDAGPQVRVEVNVASDVHDALLLHATEHGVSTDTGLRYAVDLWLRVCGVLACGDRIMTAEGLGEATSYRPVVLVDPPDEA